MNLVYFQIILYKLDTNDAVCQSLSYHPKEPCDIKRIHFNHFSEFSDNQQFHYYQVHSKI